MICTFLAFLTACTGGAPAATSVPAPTFLPLDAALGAPILSAPVGAYLLIDASGARLVAGLSFSGGATPAPADPPARQVWLDPGAIADDLVDRAQPAGNARYLAVAAAGVLEGPGAFGPDGAFGYRMRPRTITPLPWQETTVALLATTPATGQAVRVTGALIASQSEAVLVEALGPGGAPASQARQVKLRAPLRDAALLSRLTTAPGGAVRYGTVQVEGIWHDGVLVPMGMRKVEG
ncbi:MAG: hypothetical protein RMJ55_07735 [Roseiflexaceae bacterium]|nr:hypothetical protein [Roseiflexaceae bacterium]